MLITHALVRPPCDSYASGLTQSTEGPPDPGLARGQHAAYCQAFRDLGVSVTTLPDAPEHPDGTFVEDTALCLADRCIITRPGAPSRRGECASVEPALRRLYQKVMLIEAPGTVDGGDVCVAEDLMFIGLSARTNEAGADQLCSLARNAGLTPHIIDIRGRQDLLHLKSGINYLGEGLFLLCPDTPAVAAIDRHQCLVTEPDEAYAANALAVNGTVLVAGGYPRLAAALAARGRRVKTMQVSEFRKMDGGLTCLSLRIPAGTARVG